MWSIMLHSNTNGALMKLPAMSLLLLSAASAHAHDVRQQGAHVHGQATVDVALERGTLDLAMQAPGIGLLDFERPPATPQERAALARAKALLKEGAWVTLPTAAQCRLAASSAAAEGFAADPARDAGHHGHAGFSAGLRFQCAHPSALRVLVVRLPALFPGLHEVIVNSTTPAGQGRHVLTADDLRVVLSP